MEEVDHIEQAAKRKETQAQRQKRLIAAVSEVLASPSGRLVLSEILDFCQVEGFNGQDGAASGRIEGARIVGIKTIDLLRSHDFAGFMKLYKEMHDDR